jgi:aerobic carbon-monoxide dehydrogenase medium subunit
MKPAPFEYFAPESLQEALSLLEQHGGAGKILAGGQSLGPHLNMRNISPEVIIDINRLDELSYVRRQDAHLEIGALARQRTLERSTLIPQGWSLLSEAAPHIAHPTLRNRGTICGSIAYAYPAAELPAVAIALDAELRILGPEGERTVHPKDFFLTYMTTALKPTELLVEARFPPTRPRTGQAWLEIARRHGDYALVGVGAVLTLREDGVCQDARLVYTGVEAVPFGAQEAADLLVGEEPTEDSFAAAAEQAATDSEPGSDAHAPAGYRRHLVRVLTLRALQKALERAEGDGDGA